MLNQALGLLCFCCAQILQRMLDELGLDTPGKLRKFVTKSSLPVLGLSLLETVLNGVGSWAALILFTMMPWDAVALVQRGWAPSIAAAIMGIGQASSALAAGVLGANAIFSGATFFATLVCARPTDVLLAGRANACFLALFLLACIIVAVRLPRVRHQRARLPGGCAPRERRRGHRPASRRGPRRRVHQGCSAARQGA
jgi:hypothetical protein